MEATRPANAPGHKDRTVAPAFIRVRTGQRVYDPIGLLESSLIGSNSKCFISLDKRYVSEKHCAITWQNDRWTLCQIESEYGTHVNGQNVEGTIPLEHGDILRIGTYQIQFNLVTPHISGADSRDYGAEGLQSEAIHNSDDTISAIDQDTSETRANLTPKNHAPADIDRVGDSHVEKSFRNAKTYAGESTRQPVELLSLCELERQHIVRVLEHTRGRKRAASVILGINRSTLDRKIDKYEIDTDDIVCRSAIAQHGRNN